MKSKTPVQQHIEEYLKKDNVFDFILRSNLTLFKTELAQLNIRDIDQGTKPIYFECDDSYLIFLGDSIIYEFHRADNEFTNWAYKYVYIRDFEYNGFICRIGGKGIKTKIKATLMVITNDQKMPSSSFSVIKPELIDVKDFSSYRVWDLKDRDQEILKLQNQFKTDLVLLP